MGLKEPNTHVFLDRLAVVYPDMKCVHVVRNGLDMAFSASQNQLRLWGPRFLGPGLESSPRVALSAGAPCSAVRWRSPSACPGAS
ncbi:MAG: hypothetical protein R2712_03745 [Vicinamibacterales bacterium]